MKTIFYAADKRGHNDIGWLKAKFSFSFGPYYDPEKIHFGALRVLNDDIIAANTGFGMHPHDNMEIVSIILKGGLEHRDSMGNVGVIKAGEVQVMSAGTGVMHSEHNPSAYEATESLQIWLFPNERDVEPRYDQKSFVNELKNNELIKLVSGDQSDDTLFIHQDATFSMGKFDAGQTINYKMNTEGNGAYVFLLEGKIKAADHTLNKRDALGVYDTASFAIETETEAQLLVIEVPMY